MEFLTFLGNLLVFLLVLTAIISIHELGHFLLAKKAGILIHEFSIGMGPVLYQKRKGETAYSLRAIPLGGYVSMSGEDGDHSLIQKGSMIGVNLNEIGLIKEIILDQTIANPSLVGEVIDFDLYGENLKELFIELRTSEGTLQRYQVMRDAKYLFRKTKQLHITPHESSFSSKTKWERFLVLIFGSFMNFLLAFTVLIIVAIVAGKPHEHNIVDESMNLALKPGDTIVAINDLSTENIHDIRNALNATNHHYVFADLLRDDLLLEDEKVYVSVILQNFGLVNDLSEAHKDLLIIGGIGGKASSAGLKVGDEITHINGQLVTTWNELIALARNYSGAQISVTVLRDDEIVNATYDVLSDTVLSAMGQPRVDIKMGFSVGSSFDLLHIVTYPFTQFGSSVTEMVVTLGLLFNPSSGVGVGDLAGPVGIFSLVSNAASAGLINLLVFVAFLSVNIGLINLLPIPALDGGRIIFLGYEALFKKKIPAKVELWVNNIFFFLLMGLFIFVTWNDIMRIGS